MSGEAVEWVETDRGQIWRSVDGRYAIVAHTLTENPPRTVYQARKIDESMARADPLRGYLGNLLGESPWRWNSENSVHSAQAVVERDAFCSAHNTSVPEDHPAVALSPFWWPISSGTSRAALAVVWKDGQLVAQVLGMVRHDDSGFVPGEWTEINLTALGLAPREDVELATTTEHPAPCSNCGATVGQRHTAECSFAKCQVTGQQRLLCTSLGGSPVAGFEAVATNSSQGEFDQYFKTPTGHECGDDIWTGDQ